MLDIYGTSVTDRAAACIMLCVEDEPDGLEGDDRWPPPMEKARTLARMAGGDPDILARAVELVRSRVDGPDALTVDVDGLPRRNFARALVILTEARRLAL